MSIKESIEKAVDMLVSECKVDFLKGGKADSKSVDSFDPEALKKGIKVEMEHTDNPDVAREIAMDHLEEDPQYYEKLELIHKD